MLKFKDRLLFAGMVLAALPALVLYLLLNPTGGPVND